MLQIVFTLLLVAVLVAAVASFIIMGLMQIRRTRALAREAHELGLRFSPGDPFDIPRRYAHFALIGSGHGPRASNVTHGRLSGRPVRAFDFRYEAGHGTQRVARHYNVIVLETDGDLPELWMWNDNDAESAPLRSASGPRRVACWTYTGDGELAGALSEALEPLGPDGTSFEANSTGLMIFTPVRRGRARSAGRLGETIRAIRDLPSPLGGGQRGE